MDNLRLLNEIMLGLCYNKDFVVSSSISKRCGGVITQSDVNKLVSSLSSNESFIKKGYLNYSSGVFSITPLGKEYLKSTVQQDNGC